MKEVLEAAKVPTMAAIATAGSVVNQAVAGRDVNNTTIINEEPVKRLSYIIKIGEKYFETQREAAEFLGVSEVNLSRFLNGKALLDVVGEKPIRIGTRGES